MEVDPKPCEVARERTKVDPKLCEVAREWAKVDPEPCELARKRTDIRSIFSRTSY